MTAWSMFRHLLLMLGLDLVYSIPGDVLCGGGAGCVGWKGLSYCIYLIRTPHTNKLSFIFLWPYIPFEVISGH